MITILPSTNEREICAALGNLEAERAQVAVRLVAKGHPIGVAGRAALTPAFGFTLPQRGGR